MRPGRISFGIYLQARNHRSDQSHAHRFRTQPPGAGLLITTEAIITALPPGVLGSCPAGSSAKWNVSDRDRLILMTTGKHAVPGGFALRKYGTFYLRRLEALKIVSSLTSGRPLFLSHALTSLQSVEVCKMILSGTPLGQSALMASSARPRSGALLRRRRGTSGDAPTTSGSAVRR